MKKIEKKKGSFFIEKVSQFSTECILKGCVLEKHLSKGNLVFSGNFYLNMDFAILSTHFTKIR